jgi:ribonuclease I
MDQHVTETSNRLFRKKDNSKPTINQDKTQPQPRTNKIEAKATTGKGYDNLVLATEWAGSICRTRGCTTDRPAIKTFFNLHGLWPNDYEDFRNSPYTCTDTTADINKYSADVQTLVKSFWNSMYSSQNDFLNHEWTKHGTCWTPEPLNYDNVPTEIKGTLVNALSAFKKSEDDKQAAYIQMSISLAQKYNVFNALAASGILPNNQRRVNKTDLDMAFSSYYKVNKYQVICQKDKNGQSMLYEVRICLDLDYRVVNCKELRNECPAQFVYPEYM